MGNYGSKYVGSVRLDGKTAIITGCDTGIGKVTALEMYKRGCRVIMACQNKIRAELAKQDIIRTCEECADCGELQVQLLDLSSFKSIKQFADNILAEEAQINILINNAGVLRSNGTTEDGFNTMFATNHLGPFMLTLLLLPRILVSAPARIVNVSSVAHSWIKSLNWGDLMGDKRLDTLKKYGISKLGNVLISKELAKRLKGTGVNCYSLHPGVVNTDIGQYVDDFLFPGANWCYKNLGSIFQKDEEAGAATTLYCAIDPQTAEESGLYYADCKVKETSSFANREDVIQKMWETSIKMIKLDESDPFKPKPLLTTCNTRL